MTFYDSDVCRARRGGAMPTRGGMHLALAMSCLGRVVIRVFREVVVRIFQERIVVYACLATRVVCVVGAYAFPNELVRLRIEAKPIWGKIQKLGKNAVII